MLGLHVLHQGLSHRCLQTRMPYQLGYYKASLRPIMGKDCITWKCRDIDGNEYTYKYVNRIRH